MVPRLNFRPGSDQKTRNLGPPEVASESKRATPSVIARLAPKKAWWGRSINLEQDTRCGVKSS